MASSTSSSVEVTALKNAYDYLIESIDATSMASHLFEAGIITQQLYDECRGEKFGKFEKVEKIVEYLLKVVSSDPTKFYAFQQILHQTKNLTIARQLRDELAKVEESTSIEMRVTIPEDLVRNLADLRVQYASMLWKIRLELENLTEGEQEKLRFVLSVLLVNVNSNHKMLETFDTFLQQDTSLFNICHLKQFSRTFPDKIKQKTERLIDEYEDTCKQFMSSTTLNQFKELFPAAVKSSELSAGNKIMLKLNNHWGDRTLEALMSLVIHLIDFPTSHLHLVKVSEGCIAVHMLCPCHVVPELKNAVSEASDKLYENGVLQVLIGETVVLNSTNTDEASSRASDASKEVLVGLNKQEAVLDRVMVIST